MERVSHIIIFSGCEERDGEVLLRANANQEEVINPANMLSARYVAPGWQIILNLISHFCTLSNIKLSGRSHDTLGSVGFIGLLRVEEPRAARSGAVEHPPMETRGVIQRSSRGKLVDVLTLVLFPRWPHVNPMTRAW